jgi:hypothetical protein
LDDVRKFVGDQLIPGSGPGRELALAEHDVCARGEGESADPHRSRLGGWTGVHTHVVEVVLKSLLEKAQRRRIERLARGAQCCVNICRDLDPSHIAGTGGLQSMALVVAQPIGLTPIARSATSASVLPPRLRQAHYLFGEAVCLLLVLIARCAYFQLGLDLQVV